MAKKKRKQRGDTMQDVTQKPQASEAEEAVETMEAAVETAMDADEAHEQAKEEMAQDTAAAEAAEALFGGGGSLDNMPTTVLSEGQAAQGLQVVDLLVLSGLAKSRGDARRLVDGGGVSLEDVKVADVFMPIDPDRLKGDGLVIRKGKKSYHRFLMK